MVGHVLAAKGQVNPVLATGAGGGFVGAYDAFTASLAHVYEPARRTMTSYIGNLLRLRRASDSAEADFTYIANGDLDTVTIATWLGGANGYVVSVYDQKNGDTITQADTTKQPLYTATAQNGHAGLWFDGSDDSLAGAYTIGGALSQPYDTFATAQLDNSVVGDAIDRALANDDSGVEMLMRKTAANRWQIYAGATVTSAIACDATWRLWSASFNGVASVLRHDTGIIASGNAGALNANGLRWGGQQNFGTNFWKGYGVNVIICDPALSAGDRAAMETAINNYWAVY